MHKGQEGIKERVKQLLLRDASFFFISCERGLSQTSSNSSLECLFVYTRCERPFIDFMNFLLGVSFYTRCERPLIGLEKVLFILRLCLVPGKY